MTNSISLRHRRVFSFLLTLALSLPLLVQAAEPLPSWNDGPSKKQIIEFVQTVTEKLMTYALGRSVEYYDMPAVRAIVRDAARDNYRVSSIVMGIVRSAPFQMRKASSELVN